MRMRRIVSGCALHRHARLYARHPRRWVSPESTTWMAGTSSAATATLIGALATTPEREHPHARNRLRPHLSRPRRRGLGRRHVRRLHVSAPRHRPAAAAGEIRRVAAVFLQLLHLGLGVDPAAAHKRLLDGAGHIRRFRRNAALHPHHAGDRLADDRAVCLAVPRAVAEIQARGGRAGVAGRRRRTQPHPPDHHDQFAARPQIVVVPAKAGTRAGFPPARE